MKQKKDLFDLFRETANNVEQKPTKEAWDRLEQRLDQHANHRRSFSIRRMLYIAAGVVGLIGAAAILMPYIANQAQSPDLAMDEIYVNKDKTDMESIDFMSEEERGFYKVVEFQHKHRDRLSNPEFREGKPAKLMVALNTGSQSGDDATDQYSSNQLKKSLATVPFSQCIETVVQERGKISISYADISAPCSAKDEIIPDKTAAKNTQIIAAVRILKQFNFINEVEIQMPLNEKTYLLKITRTELSKLPNNPLANISKDWYERFVEHYIINTENRQLLLDKFGRIK